MYTTGCVSAGHDEWSGVDAGFGGRHDRTDCGFRVVRVEHSTGGSVALPHTLESRCLVRLSSFDIVRDASTSVGGPT